MTLDLSTELTEIVNGADAIAPPVTNALVKIQDALDAIASAAGLPPGAAGQVLKGVGPSWGQVTDAEVAAGISLSKLAGFPSDVAKFARGDGVWAVPPASGGGGGGGGRLMDSGSRVTPLSVTATTAAGAQTVVTGTAVSYDGSEVEVRFRAAEAVRGTSDIRFVLYDGSTQLGLLGREESGGPVELVVPITPSAGLHTYSVRAFVDGGTGTVQAGTGVLGAYYPATLRILSRTVVGAAATSLNVKDFGAQGDGVTDDTAAIQAAINALAIVTDYARGGIVFFPPGSYRVSAALTLPRTVHNGAYKAITLEGPGMEQADIRRFTGYQGVLLDCSGTITAGNVVTRQGFVTVRDLTLHGFNGANGGAGAPLMRCFYLSLSRFERVHFVSNLGPAYTGVEFQDSRFVDCWFEACSGTVDTNAAGTNVGTETIRLLGRDDNAVSGTTGYTTDSCNNIFHVNCEFSQGGVNGHAGFIAISHNGGTSSPHRIYFVDNKIEGITSSMKANGAMVKIYGAASQCLWIYFVNADFTGYSGGPVTWVDINLAQQVVLQNVLFDDSGGAGVTHAPIRISSAGGLTLENVTSQLGAAAGGDATNAALIDVAGSTSRVSLEGTRWFGFGGAGARPIIRNQGNITSGFTFPPVGGVSTQTPGAVATVTIAHGLGFTPNTVTVQPANANARGAPAFHVTFDGTNVTLTFAANLTAATSYAWNWTVA